MGQYKELDAALNIKKLGLNVAKLIALSIVLSIGIPFVLEGYRLSQERPPPEVPITFEAEMQPEAGPLVGKVKIDLEPTEAFVTGDRITADIEVQVYWLHENETASVYITFKDCLSTDFRWAWTNTSHYNELIFLEYNSSSAVYSTYRARAWVWYTHEGIYGFDVSVNSPYSWELLTTFGTSEGTIDWSFPVVHIKSYSYLEQRLNAQLTNALTVEVLGLTIIALSSVAVMAVDLIWKATESIFERKGKENKDNKEEGKEKEKENKGSVRAQRTLEMLTIKTCSKCHFKYFSYLERCPNCGNDLPTTG